MYLDRKLIVVCLCDMGKLIGKMDLDLDLDLDGCVCMFVCLMREEALEGGKASLYIQTDDG